MLVRVCASGVVARFPLQCRAGEPLLRAESARRRLAAGAALSGERLVRASRRRRTRGGRRGPEAVSGAAPAARDEQAAVGHDGLCGRATASAWAPRLSRAGGCSRFGGVGAPARPPFGCEQPIPASAIDGYEPENRRRRSRTAPIAHAAAAAGVCRRRPPRREVRTFRRHPNAATAAATMRRPPRRISAGRRRRARARRGGANPAASARGERTRWRSGGATSSATAPPQRRRAQVKKIKSVARPTSHAARSHRASDLPMVSQAAAAHARGRGAGARSPLAPPPQVVGGRGCGVAGTAGAVIKQKKCRADILVGAGGGAPPAASALLRGRKRLRTGAPQPSRGSGRGQWALPP
mgnify:CR=1 FL=1